LCRRTRSAISSNFRASSAASSSCRSPHGPHADPCAFAFDAFFPFADGLLAAADAGATAIIQPGGSSLPTPLAPPQGNVDPSQVAAQQPTGQYNTAQGNPNTNNSGYEEIYYTPNSGNGYTDVPAGGQIPSGGSLSSQLINGKAAPVSRDTSNTTGTQSTPATQPPGNLNPNLQGNGPAPIQSFGATPTVRPTYAGYTGAGVGYVQNPNAPSNVALGSASLVDPSQQQGYLNQYSNLLGTQLAPYFQQQQQQTEDQNRGRGLTGGAAQYNTDLVTQGQSSAFASALQPMVSQAYGYTQQDIQGNQNAQNAFGMANQSALNAFNSQGYGYAEQNALTNAGAYNANQQFNSTGLNANSQYNANTANQAATQNAGYYNQDRYTNAGNYNNYQNELFGAGLNDYNAMLAAYLNSFGPSAGVNAAFNTAVGGIGSTFSSAYGGAAGTAQSGLGALGTIGSQLAANGAPATAAAAGG
jgi:hypothetical protein